MNPVLTQAELVALADAFEVDERTLLRALVGLPVRGKAGVRAKRAVAKYRKDHAFLPTRNT